MAPTLFPAFNSKIIYFTFDGRAIEQLQYVDDLV